MPRARSGSAVRPAKWCPLPPLTDGALETAAPAPSSSRSGNGIARFAARLRPNEIARAKCFKCFSLVNAHDLPNAMTNTAPPKIEFPCAYPLKVIGHAADDFREF